MKINVHSEFENESLVYNHFTKTDHEKGEYFYHYHDVTELIFVKSGDVTYEVAGKEYLLQKNMLVIARPNERHYIDLVSQQPYERYNILFDERILPFDLYGRIPTGLNVISFDANKSVIGIFDKMDHYCKKLDGEDLGRMLFNLVCEVLMNVIIETQQDGERETDQKNPLVLRAISYIEENLLTLRDIDEVCRELYISKSHLHHLFMEQMKVSPKKFITVKRLELARRELTMGAKATEVCAACGFGEYSSFFRAYKKHFGNSPADTPKTDCVRISFSDFVKGYKV
ncbi:MAG: helix-turn-helix transcriptional regulator [Clostridia bacterium]|nr:helix-turn-helix transcriptional regulator [Clostridia bacterium]